VAGATARASPSPRAAERRIVAVGVLLTTIVLAYFYAADHSLFSMRRMTPIFQYLLMVNDSKTAWLTLGVCVAAAFWKYPVPLLKIVDFVSVHVTTVVTATVALLALGAIFVYHNTG